MPRPPTSPPDPFDDAFDDLGRPELGRPDLGPPGLSPPGLGPPDLGSPDHSPPGLGPPGLGSPGLGPPGLGPSGHGPPGLDLPPPGRRLPPWVDAVRQRLGLDGRALAWIAAVVVALLAGAWLLRPAPAAVEETLPMASTAEADGSTAPAAAPSSASTSSSSVPTEVVVHAAGAVVRPGVYALDVASRVDDLVRAAGGLAPDADGARINLAAPLADGARVYVPRIGEGDAPPVVGADPTVPPVGPGSGDPGSDEAPAAPIDLNTASEDELDELPGVGPSIAAAIVAFREENGGFASVEDLLDVRGIGEAKLAEIRPLVTV